jgi:hypothetical protein
MREVLRALRNRLLKAGLFRSVEIGEPMSPPENMTAALMLDSYRVRSATLNGLVEERTVLVRVYARAVTGSGEEREALMDRAVQVVLDAVVSEPTLGGLVRIPELPRLGVRFGYQTIGQTIYRVADVTVPVILDTEVSA